MQLNDQNIRLIVDKLAKHKQNQVIEKQFDSQYFSGYLDQGIIDQHSLLSRSRNNESTVSSSK